MKNRLENTMADIRENVYTASIDLDLKLINLSIMAELLVIIGIICYPQKPI